MAEAAGVLPSVFRLHGIDGMGGADRHQVQKGVLRLLKAPSPQIGTIIRQTVLPLQQSMRRNRRGQFFQAIGNAGFTGIIG